MQTPRSDLSSAAARARALDAARHGYHESPAEALAVAAACHEFGRAHGEEALCARATALQAAVSVHRGDVRGALTLVVAAERHADGTADLTARAEVSAVKGQVSFFAGSHTDALACADRAISLADAAGDLSLRIHARRASCLVFGNLGVGDLEARIRMLLALTVQAADRWEEAISRNDLACYLQESDPGAAEQEIERAREAAESLRAGNRFALGVILSTRADIRLAADRPAEALADARRAIDLLAAGGDPNPYVVAATVRAEVQARMTLGQLETARESGEDVLRWLGDRVPQMRGLILTTLATQLRAAGRVEEAYDALARSAELEREAFRELSELQRGLERATLEASAARRESAELAAKNRELARMHDALSERAGELEAAQAQLREQADRDWLTGLHNRRFLARELDDGSVRALALPLAVVVLDLDHFKLVNDRHGHEVGDQVLVRVARLLCDLLREHDIVVRSGGEEFLLLMPATDVRAAAAACDRLRAAIAAEHWDAIADGLAVTASVGVAVAHDPESLDATARIADERLYEAKRRGRDRVVSELSASTTAVSGPDRAGARETTNGPARSAPGEVPPSS